jgi:hypothetical protein
MPPALSVAADDRWRAIEDGGRFFAAWGADASTMQWTTDELFDAPRECEAGSLIWLLAGERVTELCEIRARLAYGRAAERRGIRLKKAVYRMAKAGKRGGFQKGRTKTGGRMQGVPNKSTVALRIAMFLTASEAGGKDAALAYLTTLARDRPNLFLSLAGKVFLRRGSGRMAGKPPT